MSFSADPLHLTTILTDLVATNSVNPRLVEGAPGETEIARLTARHMREAGLEVARYEPEAGRPSVVGRLAGAGSGQALMLNAHYDTVGVEGMEAPFSPSLRDGRLYGRGAYDMKGALAACIEAARLLREAGTRLAGDVLVAAVADEEYASLGTADLLERRVRGELAFDAAIVTEPTSLDLCVAHRGFTWIEITTRGRAAHGSRYREGIDANVRMGRILHRLEAFMGELQSRPGHPLLGPPSMHAPLLEGGSGISTYSPRCTLRVERRTVPPETRESVEAEIAAIIEDLRAEDPSLEVAWSTFFHREPFETTPEAPVAACVSRAARTVLGSAPEVIGDSPWMDSALTQAAGVDSVVIGPAGEGAHADVEWVDLASCARLAEILAEAAADYCG
ncbi:M20/M25/M40 family metallo-hydrolase [Candidatus Palauibacter polyketidifaciens]|uniref:M20/M25/M40 family metallo-hydrolase n=1 Tax=Candidatus Palauibacter polyketidifaciens TaxID=3056740 RepID=UPI002386B851|nr:M20/M25/M40 family metallo-hydrolase [Candidatus Palauibacter polyketidifaciens]MDE2719376.1 M20/M25/M40 family metallo-hydrolase [Candidatus Palauibacter polyketidifaciens]